MRDKDRLGAICGVVTVAVAVLAVGGALRWTAGLVAILAAIALIPSAWSRRGMPGLSPLVAVLGAATVLTALQLIPLPESVIEALDPTNQALRDAGSEVAGTSPWTALTMDAPGSLRALTFFITLLGVAVVALRLSSTERGRLFCLGTVTAVCAGTAAIVGIHRIFGATTLFGIYQPDQATPPIIGPLLNGNHLGGLMALGSVLAIGLVFHGKQSAAARVAWTLSAVGCVTVTLATLSRGALLALATGLGVTLGTLLAQRLARPRDTILRSTRRKFLVTTLPIATVGVCVFVLVVFTSGGRAPEQLADTSLQEINEPKSKYAAWSSSKTLVEESYLVGVGRGAFEPAFTRVHPPSAFVTFSHLENEYLQAVVEWGIPGALLLACALGWFAVTAIRRWRDGPLIAGALGGITTALVQSNVDFGIELLGLAVPLTIVGATVAFVPLRVLEAPEIRRGRALRVAHIAGLVVAALVLFLPMTTSVGEDHKNLRDDPSLATITESIERHPLDYYGYAIGAELLASQRDSKAAAMLNHALQLHPTHPGLHRFAGRLLAAKHPDQAAIEYAHALRGTSEPRGIISELIQRLPADKVPDAIPIDYSNVRLVIRALEDEKRGDLALTWIRRVVRESPKSSTAVDLMHGIATSRQDWAAAEEAARLKLKRMPSAQAKLAVAELLAKRGAHKEIAAVLGDIASWRGRISEQVTAWFLQCDAYFALKELDEAIRCLRRLDGSGLLPAGESREIKRKLELVLDARRASILVPQTPGSGFAITKPADAGSGSAMPKPAAAGSGSAITNPVGAGSGAVAPKPTPAGSGSAAPTP